MESEADHLREIIAALTERAEKAEGELCACWAIATEGSPDDYKDEPGSARTAVDAMQDRLFASEGDRDVALANAARLAEALRRACKYASEDRAVTPGSTRLARLLDGDARAALAAHDAGAKKEGGGT